MKRKAVSRLIDSNVILAALVLFVFLTCCCCFSQAAVTRKCTTRDEITQNPEDGICGTVDIRNNVTNFRKLENCTVIEGNVHISLIDRNNAEEFEKYSFPLLTEITGHLMLFRVRHLRSLRTIFPSLAIIRGQDLFYNYALVAYEMQDLEEIGLINLRTIIRGGVRITKNKKLCHVDTIDWSRIAIGAEPSEHHFMDNKEERRCANYCPDKCDTTKVEGVESKRCWTSQHCQKNLNCNCNGNRACMDNGTCCHKFCLAGCSGPLPSDCLGCRGVVFDNTCQPRCPRYTYMFSETRCLVDKDCLEVANRSWAGETQSKLLKATEAGETNRCVIGDCPPGYMVQEEGDLKGRECIKCKDFCPKVCNSTEVNSIQDLQRLKGCSKIIGPLVIQIMGGTSVAQEMEKNLGEIREVTGYINIRRSFALIHLYFFKKLEIIGGETLAHQGHSLIVMDNVNLVELFPKGHKIKIKHGRVAFHTNRRLCVYKIKEFVKFNNLTTQPTDISEHTNGDQIHCSPEQMTLNVTQITHESAVLVWEKNMKDLRQLLTYNINYKEVPKDDPDVNMYLGRDACYDEVWMNKEQQPTEDKEPFQMGLLPKLKPYTKYAAYVQVFTLEAATSSAMTDIKTFYTLPYYPSEPLDLEVSPTKDPRELHVKWKPPKHPNGVITYYKLTYIMQALDHKAFDLRNYCDDPLTDRETKVKSRVEEEQKKQNVSGNCCLCPKSKKELEKERDKRQMEVFFENHLQNNVYCKRFDSLPPKVVIDKNLTDQWKIMNEGGGSQLPHGGGDVGGAAIQAILKQGINDTATGHGGLEANRYAHEKRKYEIPFSDRVKNMEVYNVTETVINNLEPFMEYVIELQACQDTSPNMGGLCSSSRAITAGRTKALPENDKLNETTIRVNQVTNRTGEVIITWAAPRNPNGLILKYFIKYKRTSQSNMVAHEKCVNRRMYKAVGGCHLDGLEPGNWTFQVITISLTGKPSESKERFFIIDPNPSEADDKYHLIVIIVIVFVVLIAIILVGCGLYIKSRNQSREPITVISENKNYLNSSDLIDILDGWEVDRDKIKLLEPLGKGSFGMVYKGLATGIRNEYPDEEMLVAVKTVNDKASFIDRRDFLKEATTMKAFDCYHVVKLLGVVSTGQPALVIMELMATDLKNYLREHRPDECQPEVTPPRIQEILQMAGEIADGMAYLADKKFVHRDLAARNCMVAEDATVKIGDFGMARDIYETDYYRKGGRGMLPVRWMAPESLRDGVFTSLSDVWSYGVVLWEMVTLAAQPYQGLSNEEVVKYVSDRRTMAVPEMCPHQMETLMKRCWQKQRERPTFLEIIHFLEPYLNDKFRELSFYFTSGSHLTQVGGGGGDADSASKSCSHDLFDADLEGASAFLQTDVRYLSQSSIHSEMGEDDHHDQDNGDQDHDEFCSDKLDRYNRDPLTKDDSDHHHHHRHHHQHPHHHDDDDDDDDDDESDSRCLMLGSGGPGPGPIDTTTAAPVTVETAPGFSSSPLLGQEASIHLPFHPHHHHQHPSHPSHKPNQGLYELQPLIAPAGNNGQDASPSSSSLSSSPMVKATSMNTPPPPLAPTSMSSPSSSTSSPSLSWNPRPHHPLNKSSLPSTSTSPVSNNNNNRQQQALLMSPPSSSSSSSNSPPHPPPSSLDYLGYNPGLPQAFSLPPPQQSNPNPAATVCHNNLSTGGNNNHFPNPQGSRGQTDRGGLTGVCIPQQDKERPPLLPPSSSSSSSSPPSFSSSSPSTLPSSLPPPPPPSSSSSSPSSRRDGAESDRLLWPCSGSSSGNNGNNINNNNNNNNNNSISRPSLRLPVLNQPPGGSFHRSSPSGGSGGSGGGVHPHRLSRHQDTANKAGNGDNTTSNQTVGGAGGGISSSSSGGSGSGSQNVAVASPDSQPLEGRLWENSGNSSYKEEEEVGSGGVDGGGHRVQPLLAPSSSLPSSSSSSSIPSSSLPSLPPPPPSSSSSSSSSSTPWSQPPPSSSSPYPHPPLPPLGEAASSSSEGSQDSTKSNKSSSVGSGHSSSSVPLMNGYTNGHAPPPPPPPPPPSSSTSPPSSLQPRTALC